MFKNRINSNFDDLPSSERFQYNPFKKKPKRRNLVLGILIILSIVVILIIFWWWPSWFADISLQQQLYLNKAGSDFSNIFFLNFWSTSFFFNKTALIGALIGSIIMSIPPDRTLLTVLGTRLRFGRPSYLKSLIFWWTVGFAIFYLSGFLLNFDGNTFSWAAYLVESGELTFSGNILIDAFDVIFDPFNQDYITIFLYSNLLLPIIAFFFIILIFRVALNILKSIYLKRNDYYVIANIFILVGLAFGLWLFNLPTLSLDGIGIIQSWSILIGFIIFTVLGFVSYLYSRYSYKRDSKKYIFPPNSFRKLAYIIFLLIIILIIPLFISIGPAININNSAVWLEQQWTKKFKREVDWTTECAGLDMFETRDISNFTESTTSSDALIVSQIRQYDQDFAVQYLAASIGSTFEGLADSDIVYINNKEYWVAPKTIKFTQITDPVQRSTELLDHVEGFLAMDTFSGELVNTTQVFNITQNYPIFFGESESEKFLRQTIGSSFQEGTVGAYDSDILLGTEWAGNQINYDYIYSSTPDATLSGLESFWKKINLGLIAYVGEPINDYLINRNVKKRVGSILLPQLKIDNDPYLIFNMNLGKLFYAVSIYTSINVGSYAKYPILRFLGVCLVDVFDGDLTFYKNPKLDTENDPTYPLWKLYLSNDIYDWNEIGTEEEWLKDQLRYPEDLFEQQLEANYIYHVDDPTDWKSEVDFHERPNNGDLFYIESDLGEGIEFVGLDLVEYRGRTATLLAGMYMVRHGDHFGEAIFYQTRGSDLNLIGPRTANQTYNSEATQELSLIAGKRNGNFLLYPLAGSLYYYIPTYSTAGTLQDLKLAGFVEAFTREVGYGANAQEAYIALNISGIVPISNISLSYDFEVESTINLPNDLANFRINLQNTDFNYSANPLDVKVNLTLYTSLAHDLNYTLIVPEYLYPLVNTTYTFIDGTTPYKAVNFTLVDTNLYFGEGITLNGFISTTLGNINIFAIWTLYLDGDLIYQSPANVIQVLE